MKTNIILNDDLLNEAINLSGLKTPKAVVEEGLKLLVKLKKQEKTKFLRGKLKWEGDLKKRDQTIDSCGFLHLDRLFQRAKKHLL